MRQRNSLSGVLLCLAGALGCSHDNAESKFARLETKHIEAPNGLSRTPADSTQTRFEDHASSIGGNSASPDAPANHQVQQTSYVYPSTGIEMFDPLPNLEQQVNLGSDARDDRDLARVSPANYDRIKGVSVPANVQPTQVVGSFSGGSEYIERTRLSIRDNGTFEYSQCAGCYLSYVGYEGHWELEGNVLRLRHATPDESYRSLTGNTNHKLNDPFLQFDVLLFNGETVLVDSDRNYEFLKVGIAARDCFRHSVER